MKSRCIGIIATAIFVSLCVTGCSERREISPLYLLEELEAASAVDDPSGRIERLEIFVRNHPDHQFRGLAYRRILETMVEERGDTAAADDFFEQVLARETDPRIRGGLYYARFSTLWKRDRERALSLTRELVSGSESYYRLFLYMSYYLVWDEDYEKNAPLAEQTLGKAIETAADVHERNQAVAVLGGFKERLGLVDEALTILEPVAGTYDADEVLARLLWDRGERERALDAHIRVAAVVPGARARSSLDSLYALVHGDSSGLDEKIWEKRIIDGGQLHPQSFVDIEGKRFDLGGLTDTKLIVSIWQPT